MTRLLNGLAIIALVAAIWLRNPLLFLLTVLLALVAGVTALWDRYALTNVSYTRALGRPRLFAGEETHLEIEIVNAKLLPLAWLQAEDEFPAAIEMLKGKVHYSYKPLRRVLSNLLSLRFYERVRKRYPIRAPRRGVMEFGPVQLRSGDLFGFKYQRSDLPHVDRLIVYPKVVPVTALSLPPAYPFGDDRAKRRIVDDPLRIAGVRPYAPGDNLRFIHWKASARRGALQSKIFDPSAARVSAIFLDLRTVYDYSGIISDYVELGISAAASVARHLLDQREAVGLYVNSRIPQQRHLVRLPPNRRPDCWLEILDTLAWLGDLSFAAMDRYLQAEMGSLPYGATIIVISAVITDSLVGALLDTVRAGHPTGLLAMGEEPPRNIPDDIQCHWIGGREAYRGLTELSLDDVLLAESEEGSACI